MSSSPESRVPRIKAAEGFIMPALNENDAKTVEQIFDLHSYVSAPLIPAARRREIFGTETPTEVVGPFSTDGFIVQTLTPLEGRAIGAETIVAPPSDMTEREFLVMSLHAARQALPDREDFPLPLARIATAMSRIGLRAVAGFNRNVSVQNPEVRFDSLLFPRIYRTQDFHGGAPEGRDEFAIKLASMVFSYLTLEQINDIDGEAGNN